MKTAQEILNDIEELDIQHLYEDDIPKPERSADIKLIKQKIRLIKKALKEAQKAVKQEWDARKGNYFKRRQEEGLAPLNLVETLIANIEVNLTELETSIKFDRDLPDIPVIGTILFPQDEPREILTKEQAIKKCEEENSSSIEYLKNRGKELTKELKNLEEELENTKGWFSGGKRKKLSEQITETQESIKSAKSAILYAQYFSMIQKILESPFCANHIKLTLVLTVKDGERKAGLKKYQAKIEQAHKLKKFLQKNSEYLGHEIKNLNALISELESFVEQIKDSLERGEE